ncbi:MAG TPA: hypothetical protein VLR46_00665 [Candidatus Dormibacteraeota bacterium]|nr:hypothetical protein [Candidatus Dormibacteraeota bacterium]
MPPVLAVGKEEVRGRADPHAGREQVLPPPGVEAIRRKAHRHVGDEADLARGARQLAVELELHPFVKSNPGRELVLHLRQAFTARMAEGLGPASPGLAMHLGNGVERRELAQGTALAARPTAQSFGLGRHLKDALQRRRLEPEDERMVDDPFVVEGARRGAQGLELFRHSFRALDLLHAQVVDVQETARGRVVGAGLLRMHRWLGAEWVDQDRRRAGGLRPAAELAQVREVAYAPAVPRPHGVKLHRPSPRARRWWRAATRRNGVAAHPPRPFGGGAQRLEDGLGDFGRGFDNVPPITEVAGQDAPTFRSINHARPKYRCCRGTAPSRAG